MNEIIRLKGYSKTDHYVKLNAIGMHATMHLLNLLWQDKTCIGLAKVKYDTTHNTITIDTKDYKYEFENVPLQWNGDIDIATLYKQHIQLLKESEVI